uniref:Uncharacterized protein n=1 Tax=Arundo donax TaxID=35708 RepID=A0A0A8YUW3_ARUDO
MLLCFGVIGKHLTNKKKRTQQELSIPNK